MPYKDKAKQSAYQVEFHRRRRNAWLTDNGPCKICGGTENLEVDHINAKRKVSHRIWSWTEKRRLVELRKCQVLCRACHMAKGIAAGERPHQIRRHGGYAMYGSGCRCSKCFTWKQKENAKRKVMGWQ